MFALAFLTRVGIHLARKHGRHVEPPGGAIGGAEFDGTQAISNRFRSGQIHLWNVGGATAD